MVRPEAQVTHATVAIHGGARGEDGAARAGARRLPIVTTAIVFTIATVNGTEKGKQHPSAFDAKPWWRERSDCGVQALYVLSALCGRTATIGELRRQIEVDSERGCSIEDLRRAARQVGLDTDVLFVTPGELPNVSTPYILHNEASVARQTGHFAVVVSYDANSGRFAVINPELEIFGWFPEKSVMKGFTGYLLVVRRTSMADAALAASAAALLSLILLLSRSARRFP